MSLAQIGEFSFIIAGLGVASGATRPFLFPVAIAVSVLTALTTPLLIRAAGPVSTFVDRHLPHSIQTFAALYGSWVRTLGKDWDTKPEWKRIRRRARFLLLDCILIGALVITSALHGPKVAGYLAHLLQLRPLFAQAMVALAVLLVSLPFFLGAVRVGRTLCILLTQEAFPMADNSLDLAEAPRKALLVTLELTVFFVAGAPLVALTQPFLPPGVPFAVVLVGGLALLAIPFWKSTTNLQGHVRAGAQVILETLVRQSHSAQERSEHTETLRQLLPGMGEPTVVTIQGDADCVGRTLKELDIRGLTGATVLAIERRPDEVIFPTAHEPLREQDVLVLTGSHESVIAAKAILEKKGLASSQTVTDGDLVG
jgi:CPA2 family monovalent cation:H+ antiporter-2